MLALAVILAVAPIAIAAYAYVVYPCVLWLLVRFRRATVLTPDVWPAVTITVPVYNASQTIRKTLTHLLEVDYPKDRLQLLVLSDASTDGTDDVVREFAPQGVELLRAPVRQGKTAAENSAVALARGEVIVNVDASISIPSNSLKCLMREFSDPTVGVASGRDISTEAGQAATPAAESGYTNYEMWLRNLETRAGSIIGASGCFYGIRRRIRSEALPSGLSWDFASTLVARQQGYRSVSVPDAVCYVPRSVDMRIELTRKSRTMARGLSTLFHFADLMNPFRYGRFAIMLVSHKLLRWLPFLMSPIALVALGVIATQSRIAAVLFAIAVSGLLIGASAISGGRAVAFKPLAMIGFVVAALTAGFIAWIEAMKGTRMATWDPTARPSALPG